jgi:hypothetical protein
MSDRERAPLFSFGLSLVVPRATETRRPVVDLDFRVRLLTIHVVLGGLIAAAAFWFVVRLEQEERRKAEARADELRVVTAEAS